jgi:hypothetical protein
MQGSGEHYWVQFRALCSFHILRLVLRYNVKESARMSESRLTSSQSHPTSLGRPD